MSFCSDVSVCLDDVQEEKTNPIANGSAGEETEQTPTNENGKAFIKPLFRQHCVCCVMQALK